VALTGSNLPAVGQFNRAVVLEAIRRSPGGVSRVDIADMTALSSQTVSNVCKRLLESGLVRDTGTRVQGPGKPPVILELDPEGGFAVGVHIDPAVVTYVLVDLTGAVRGRVTNTTPIVQHPEAVIDEMAESIEALIAASGVDRERILGVGIASPGPIDAREGVVLDPPMLPRWHRVALRRELSEATGLPVLLEKDVTAAVVAELWFAGQASSGDFAFMYYGTGLGTGLSVGGEVLRGSSSNAGDAGHMTVDPEGPVCSCGRRGCVGDAAVPRSLVHRAVERGILPADCVDESAEVPDVDEAFTRLAQLSAEGDPGAREIFVDAAGWLAHSVVLIVNLLDADEVIFGGPFWGRIAPVVMEILPGAVVADPAFVLQHPIRFTESAIGVDGTAIGAASLVLDNTFSPRPRALLLGSE
jgi:predicted NBD/HSP70 family sugar kinase